MSNFKIHEIQGYIQTIYLVEQNDSFLMLDGGCASDVEKVKNYLESLGKSIKDLRLVIVTHAHPDHSGGANKFSRLYNIPIAAPENLNDWYKGIAGFVKYWVDLLLAYMVAIKKTKRFENMLFERHTHIDITLYDGDAIKGFEGWSALTCPGHTNVDLSIVNLNDKIAYIADNLVGTDENFLDHIQSVNLVSIKNHFKDILI